MADDLAFLRTLAETRSFTNGRPQSVQLTPDGATALFLRGLPRKPELRLFAFDLATGAERELASPEAVLGAGGEQLSTEEKARRERMRISARGIVGYQLSKDGQRVLFTLGGRAFVVGVDGAGLREVAGPGPKGEPIFDPHLSPDGLALGFLRGGELWVQPLSGGEPRAVTSGATALVTHGRAEYVAQEELSRYRGWWWSPDSQQLLYEEVDNRGVEQLWLQDPASMFKPVEPLAYPRPGKPNAKIRFGLVPAAGGATRWIDHQPAVWEYVSRVFWERGGPLCLTVVTRDQRELALLAVEVSGPAAGQTRELLRERDEPFLNPERELRWLRDGSFLWNSERGGAWQLFRHEATGEKLGALTAVEAGFVRTLGLDEARGVAFVQTAPTPVTQAVAEVSLDPAAPRLTTLAPPGLPAEGVTALFARRSAARVFTTQAMHGAPRTLAVRADGAVAGELRSIAEEAPQGPRLQVQQVGAPLVGGKPAKGGGFWTALIRPRDFDPAKRYPVLLQVYGGPHALRVRANASSYVIDQWIADHGFLVAYADNRGTPLRGRDWEREIAGKLGEVPLADQVEALQALAAGEPAMDLGRVGVMGHSYGGYLAARAVMERPDVFRAAVAGAPVVDWRNYDSTYTERYLGVPPPLGTSEAYEKNGLLACAARLSRPLLLIHGTADDNVHFSESLLLGDALFRAGKPYELLPQAGQTHMFVQPDLQVRYWERIFAFFRAHL